LDDEVIEAEEGAEAGEAIEVDVEQADVLSWDVAVAVAVAVVD
jgi:hypothetical protein